MRPLLTQVPTLKGTEVSLPYYNVSCIFFNKYLYFSYYMAEYFLDRPCTLCFTGKMVSVAPLNIAIVAQSETQTIGKPVCPAEV